MITELKLINFRQHRDLTVNFTAGLNVIRGANEQGKSSLLEAISYAVGGARSLRESLEDVVTWGEPESTMRVEMKFNYDGVPGVVKRGKSGAEVLHGETFVTGQDAVTAYFNKLHRTDAKMAANLQMASQGKVRGSIESGAAVTLIENLADFSLLETIVSKVQNELPSGSTGVVTDRIVRLKEALAEPVAVSDGAAQARVAAAAAAVGQAQTELQRLQERVQEGAPARKAAQDQLTAAEQAKRRRAAATADLQAVQAKLQAPAPTGAGSPEDIAAWRKAALAESQRAELRKVYLQPVPTCEFEWSTDRKAFDAAVSAVEQKVESLISQQQQLTVSRATKVVLKINEKSCSFCKKDLADVPEVAKLNAALDADIQSMTTKLADIEKQLAEATAESAAYSKLRETDHKIQLLFPAIYWNLDMTKVPAQVSWIGTPPGEADTCDYASLIRKAEAAAVEVSRHQGSMAVLQADAERLQAVLAEVVPDTAESEAVMAATTQAIQAEQAATAALVGLEREHVQAKHDWEMQQARLQAQMTARGLAQDALKEAEAELAAMVVHNELIRKVRSARPVVANELWMVVLTAVSHYTTKGRGEPSVVTRDGDGFKINGRALAGYSGSAQDVLGLAVRIGLLKTFLPSVPFMMLDEIAAACDDDRELNMLGMVMSADFPQVLLVTHSDAAESFATNLVQI